MSKLRRISTAAVASAATVGLIFGVLTIYPVPIVGGVFAAAGFPLGALIFHLTPDSVIHDIAPSGGPDAVAWAIAFGALVTWFLVFLALWMLVLRRMRSNPTPHVDARDAACQFSRPAARAGGRER